VLAGFLMKGTGDVRQTFMILGGLVLLSALCAIGVRFKSTAIEGATPVAA
jgi:NNP family nitrate/nitrite transporter-like MFS transporter